MGELFAHIEKKILEFSHDFPIEHKVENSLDAFSAKIQESAHFWTIHTKLWQMIKKISPIIILRRIRQVQIQLYITLGKIMGNFLENVVFFKKNKKISKWASYKKHEIFPWFSQSWLPVT